MADQMKIFVSWSKARSQQVALALDDFLEKIFPDAEIWMSAKDIGLGKRWDQVLNEELEDTNYGILCLTMENLDKPWLMFEAGSLSKQVEDSRVIPYRFQVPVYEVQLPISQFQGIDASKEGTLILVQALNDFLDDPLPFKDLETTFEDFWPAYEAALNEIPPSRLDGKARIDENRKIHYAFKAAPNKKVGIYTGDIKRIKDIDIWVSSENTNMQMARYYDLSISGIIRYLGAERNLEGDVVNDVIANELRGLFPADDTSIRVKTASAFATPSGELLKSHKVKNIIHVASVQGEDGRGYVPVANMQDCVYNALEKAEELAAADGAAITSILFPLLGAGTAKGDLGEIIAKLLKEALIFFKSSPDSKINEVYFLAFNKDELWALQDALGANDELDLVD